MHDPSRFDHLASEIIRAALTIGTALEPVERWHALCAAHNPEFAEAQRAASAADDDLRAALSSDQYRLVIRAADAANDVDQIEREATFELGKRCGRSEASGFRYRPTPLELFLDVLTSVPELPHLTDEGTHMYRARVRTAMPFIPGIIAAGGWNEWTTGLTGDAITALVNMQEPIEDGTDYREAEAAHIVGLLTGLALAHALQGSRGQL